MRFVTSGVGGVIVGAGFVARGGVDGRSMMSDRSGDQIPKEQCEEKDSWLRHEITIQVKKKKLERKGRLQSSREKFDSGTSMTAMGGGGADCRDLEI